MLRICELALWRLPTGSIYWTCLFGITQDRTSIQDSANSTIANRAIRYCLLETETSTSKNGKASNLAMYMALAYKIRVYNHPCFNQTGIKTRASLDGYRDASQRLAWQDVAE